jgi:hypothetical protein
LVGFLSAVVYRASDEGGLNEYHAVEVDMAVYFCIQLEFFY